MKQVTISLYSLDELSKDAKQKAIDEHLVFISDNRQEWESEDEFDESYAEENLILNDYLFYKDGTIAHCTTYTGKHEKAGITEFNFHGQTYTL